MTCTGKNQILAGREEFHSNEKGVSRRSAPDDKIGVVTLDCAAQALLLVPKRPF